MREPLAQDADGMQDPEKCKQIKHRMRKQKLLCHTFTFRNWRYKQATNKNTTPKQTAADMNTMAVQTLKSLCHRQLAHLVTKRSDFSVSSQEPQFPASWDEGGAGGGDV